MTKRIEPSREDTDPNDMENPEDIIDDIVGSYDEIQETLSEKATIAGEEKERFKSIRPYWAELASEATNDPDKAEVYSSGVEVLRAHRERLENFKPRLAGITVVFDEHTYDSDLALTTTGGTISAFAQGAISYPDNLTLPRNSRYEQTQERLVELAEALADTYVSIREVLYATKSDPERGALYLTRQLFDHFFSLLAPDESVRESDYWEAKEDADNPNLVTRHERIVFAANMHVLDEEKRDFLIKNAKHMKSVYKVLNRAHTRGELHEKQAREALREMYTLIETWVWAIELPLSFDRTA